MKGCDNTVNTVTVVDARMGRGKTSAAMRYMKEHSADKRFLFVTPYLSEVERIRGYCDFEIAADDLSSKSANLKLKMRSKRNLAITHALFYLMDNETLTLAKENGYSLIVDESIDVIEKIPTSAKDYDLIIQKMVLEEENGRLHWIDPDYEGRFNDYKELADNGNLFRLDSALLKITNPDIFDVFEEVIMLTYLFDGQTQKAYLDYFRIPYRVVGVELDESGYRFSDGPDSPPPIDLRGLIHIVDRKKMNELFSGTYALSKNWYSRRSASDPSIEALRRNLNNLFTSIAKADATHRIWTCFKDDKSKVTGAKGKFASSFLPMNIRATNEYRQATTVAYLVNRFCDPNLIKFFAVRGIEIDNDKYALSEMIQFIWRSSIRDGNPITLYVPSERMRNLLINWMDSICTEGENSIE